MGNNNITNNDEDYVCGHVDTGSVWVISGRGYMGRY